MIREYIPEWFISFLDAALVYTLIAIAVFVLLAVWLGIFYALIKITKSVINFFK